jgi:hypothetical protein
MRVRWFALAAAATLSGLAVLGCSSGDDASKPPFDVRVQLHKAEGDTPEYVDVDIFGKVCDAATAERMNKEERCTMLNIQCDTLEASFFESLKQMPDIEHLTIGSRTIEDVPFSTAGFPSKLQSLQTGSLTHRDRIPLTDNHFKDIKFSEHIKRFWLDDTQCGDATVSQLKHCNGIDSANFNNSRITDKGIEILGTLPNLKTLCIRGNKITDEGVKHLAHCKALDFVDLRETQITDKAVEFLVDCPLRDVALDNTAVTDACLLSLAKIETLQRMLIDGDGTRISKAALEKFHNREAPYQ